jgi:hypothetical protein
MHTIAICSITIYVCHQYQWKRFCHKVSFCVDLSNKLFRKGPYFSRKIRTNNSAGVSSNWSEGEMSNKSTLGKVSLLIAVRGDAGKPLNNSGLKARNSSIA